MSEEKQAEVGLEDANWGDPSGEGLTAGLDKFFDQEDEAKLKLAPEPEKVEEKAEEVVTTEDKEDVKAKEEVEEKTKPIMDEDFFSEEDDKKEEVAEKDTEGFDDKEFEKETEALTEGMDAKPGEKFKALRGELKELKQAALEATIPDDTIKEIADLKLKLQESDGLRARLDEVTSKSAKLQVESSDEYENSIMKPVASIFSKADELAEAFEIDADHIKAIIKESSEAKRGALVEEFLDSVPAYNQARIINLSDDFSKLLQKRESMLSNADETISKGQAAAIEKEQSALNEQRKITQTIQKDIFERYKDRIPGFVEDGKDTAKFSELVAQGLSIDFGKARARDQAFAAFAGVTLPHAMQAIDSLQKELADYRAEDVSAKKGSTSTSGSVKAGATETAVPAGFVNAFLEADFSS